MRTLRHSHSAAARPQPRTLQWLALLVSLGMLAVTGSLAAAWSATGSTIPDRSIYVTNQLHKTLSVIDRGNYEVVAAVTVGTSPAGGGVSPGCKYASIPHGRDE